MKFNKVKIILILLILLISLLIFLSYLNENKIISGFDTNKSEYLKGIDKIYWINLERSVNRKEKMEEFFKDEVFNGIEIERISAVDGKSNNINEILNNKLVNQNNKYTKIEHACLLSHLNTIKKCNESNNNIALIMEDDNTLEYKQYWKESLTNIIKNAPSDWEIILLGYNYQEKLNDTYTKTGLNNKIISSAGSYLINKKGTDKIMKSYKNNKFILNRDLPVEADNYLFTECISYTYKYPYFTYSFENDSEIHSDHLNAHNNAKRFIAKDVYGLDL
jgi:GR25 family glycosyltransferase involved in LPS biosynthesis